MKKIILLGYMGCGKSTIANKLSKVIQIPFVDLDEMIVERMNLSINAIFEKYGEIYFRKIEHDIFIDLLNAPESLIIGLGGGTPCYANNHVMLNGDNVVSVYLRASIETLFNRLTLDTSTRPLIANKSPEDMKEFIAMHLFERSFYYNQAQYKVVVDDKTVDRIAAEIANLLT